MLNKTIFVKNSGHKLSNILICLFVIWMRIVIKKVNFCNLTFCQNSGHKMSSNSFVCQLKMYSRVKFCKLNRTVSWARVLTKGWWDGRQENMDMLQIETVGGQQKAWEPAMYKLQIVLSSPAIYFSCHMATNNGRSPTPARHLNRVTTMWPPTRLLQSGIWI